MHRARASIEPRARQSIDFLRSTGHGTHHLMDDIPESFEDGLSLALAVAVCTEIENDVGRNLRLCKQFCQSIRFTFGIRSIHGV